MVDNCGDVQVAVFLCGSVTYYTTDRPTEWRHIMTAPGGLAGALSHRVNELISTLHLTQDEVGEIVDASGRSVARWANGEVVPQKLNKQRLIELAYVADAVAEVIPPDRANLWMFTPNRLLDHDRPADRIRVGDYKSVLDLIEAIADGVVV
jgi:hypothetical protein